MSPSYVVTSPISARQAAAAILDEMLTRKGFPEFLATVEDVTQERMLESWTSIIEQVVGE